MSRSPPDGLQAIEHLGARAWVRPDARAWVEAAVAGAGTIYERARREFPGSSALRGRAPVFVVSTGGPEWVVRHYVRGGLVASALGDRYLRVGHPRPFREAVASELLRRRGVSTPRVVAAAVYPAGPFYRGDLVTERVAGARELADVLFGADGIELGSPLRLEALRETNRLIEAISAAGAYHPDLNVKNVLVETGSAPLRIHVLDLDRCRVGGPRTAAAGRRMRRRLLRSAAKWEARTGHRLSGRERAALLLERER